MIIINFNPVSSKKLYIQIYNQILEKIKAGTLKVGDKLPSERELCELFGVSRAPIRQALSALEMNGFIYSRQGEGAYVKNIHNENASSYMLESVSPEDIVDARMNIEPIIARQAAKKATTENIKILNETLMKMKKETEEGIYSPLTDEDLHKEIALASQNELFITFMNTIINAMKQQEMWQFIRDRTVTRPDYRDINFEEHKAIIEAIKNKDEDAAYKQMSDHMENLYNRYWKI